MRDLDYDNVSQIRDRDRGGVCRPLAINALAASVGLTLAGFLIYAMASAAVSAGLEASPRMDAGLASLVTALVVGLAAICAPLVPKSILWPSLLLLAVVQFFFAFAGVITFFA